MTKIFILLFAMYLVTNAQANTTPLSLDQVETLIRDPLGNAKTIEFEIRKHGLSFPATEKIHAELMQLHLRPSTWALILKVAPTGWEMLKHSPPNIMAVAASERVVFAANNTNQIHRSDDKGVHWSPVEIANQELRISSVAFCGTFWIAAGRDNRSMTVFVSNDGKSWSNVRSWRADVYKLEYGIPISCDRNTIVVGTPDSIVSSSDQGNTWQKQRDGMATALLVYGGQIEALIHFLDIDRFGQPDLGYPYCYLPPGKIWKCERQPYIDMIAIAHLGDTVCISSDSSSLLLVSSNRGQSWGEVNVLPERIHESIHGLLPVGKHIVATTVRNGVWEGDDSCENWHSIGVEAPNGVSSIANDGEYFYVGADDGLYRMKASAVPKQ